MQNNALKGAFSLLSVNTLPLLNFAEHITVTLQIIVLTLTIIHLIKKLSKKNENQK
jgi:hypothetical protein